MNSRFLCLVLMMLGAGIFSPHESRAQIYFYQLPDEVKAKAARSGFEPEATFGSLNDSLRLVFYKATDKANKLTCYFDRAGFCYQFSYTLPARSVTDFHKNLSTNFTRRASGLWESKEKNFLLEVEDKAGFTTVTYLPYTTE